MADRLMAIGNEVSDFWSSLDRTPEAPPPKVNRGPSITVITLADSVADIGAVREVLSRLVQNQFCRTILISLDGGDAEHLEVRKLWQTGMPAGEQKELRGNHVEISASAKSIGEAPPVLASLVTPELPVVIWCQSERATRLPVFNRIVQISPRVIFDSTEFKDAHAALKRMEGIFHDDFAVVDLAWTRLSCWRDMISQVFENVVRRKDLRRFRQVTMNYFANPVSAVPAPAILLGGWLTNCLGWTGKGRSRREGAQRILEFDDGATLNYKIVGPERAGSRLASLSAVAPNDPALEIKFIQRQDHDVDVIINAAGGPASESRISFPSIDDASLLGKELLVTGRDSVFACSLGSAVRIAEHWG